MLAILCHNKGHVASCHTVFVHLYTAGWTLHLTTEGFNLHEVCSVCEDRDMVH